MLKTDSSEEPSWHDQNAGDEGSTSSRRQQETHQLIDEVEAVKPAGGLGSVGENTVLVTVEDAGSVNRNGKSFPTSNPHDDEIVAPQEENDGDSQDDDVDSSRL